MFAESCAAEEFLRDTGRRSLRRGDTASAKYTGVLADAIKAVREKRFPKLVKDLKKGSH